MQKKKKVNIALYICQRLENEEDDAILICEHASKSG